MADRKTRTQRPAYEILAFERPILELETKILELEELSKGSDLNLNGEIQGLKDQLGRRIVEVFHGLDAWEKVQVARAAGRPLATDYIEGMCDEFLELHGDRLFRDDPAVLAGLASIGDLRCLIIAHRKGRDLDERISCNFGSAHPEGYRKALRKMRLAEKFGLPIICLINTPGAYPGIGAEERGQAWAIAENLEEMFQISVPIVGVVISEGGSGGALGIGIADRVLMLEHAYYSVISPEGCAAILWRDRARASDAAAALKLSAQDLEQLGVVDEVVEEPVGAAHRDPGRTIETVRERIVHHIRELQKFSSEQLLASRYDKFRQMGTVFESVSPLSDEIPQEVAGPAPEIPADGDSAPDGASEES